MIWCCDDNQRSDGGRRPQRRRRPRLLAGAGDDRRFLVIGHGEPGVEAARQALEAVQRRWFGEPGHRDGVILWGPLLADAGAGWVGSALLVQRATVPRWRPCWPARPMCGPGCMRAWRSMTGSSADAPQAH